MRSSRRITSGAIAVVFFLGLLNVVFAIAAFALFAAGRVAGFQISDNVQAQGGVMRKMSKVAVKPETWALIGVLIVFVVIAVGGFSYSLTAIAESNK